MTSSYFIKLKIITHLLIVFHLSRIDVVETFEGITEKVSNIFFI